MARVSLCGSETFKSVELKKKRTVRLFTSSQLNEGFKTYR